VWPIRAAVVVVAAAVVFAGCGDDGGSGGAALDRAPGPTEAPVPDPAEGAGGAADSDDGDIDGDEEPALTEPPATAEPPEPPAVDDAGQQSARRVELRLERRVDDPATEGFEEVVVATLTDPRGWERAGFELAFGDDAPYVVVLAEGDVVDELCHPYTTGGRFSCQNGPVVALNADRWREATPEWTGDLDGYRQMLVNHEVGHLLGEHHPELQCPGPGQPAPVMAQQSTELADCLPNPWPLDWEIDCTRDHPGPLAPGFERGPELRCGPDGPAGR
jgi:hypothetical protein